MLCTYVWMRSITITSLFIDYQKETEKKQILIVCCYWQHILFIEFKQHIGQNGLMSTDEFK